VYVGESYPLIRIVLKWGLVDQSKYNNRPGVVFIVSSTSLMCPEHIEISNHLAVRQGIVAANREYILLLPVSGCLGFNGTSKIPI